jgi:hypothetical protein
MTNMVYVGLPTSRLSRFARIVDDGPAGDRDGRFRQVLIDGDPDAFIIISHLHMVPVEEFDEWREQRAFRLLEDARVRIQDDLLVDIWSHKFEVEVRPVLTGV